MNTDPKKLPESRASALPQPIRRAFLTGMILGILLHFFAFSNLIPNSDGLGRMYDTQQMTVSGRWFLHYASMLHGFVQAPALIGALSVLFLSAAAAMTADVLELRRESSGIAVGASFVMVPALAYTFLYMFTASAYAFAVMLAVASVWLVRKRKWGFFPGVLLLACSVGTYQAYFSAAAALGLLAVLLDLLNREKTLRTVLREGLRMLGMLAAAAVVYGGILVLFLKMKHLQLLPYRGIDQAGTGFSAEILLKNIIAAYYEFAVWFLRPRGGFSGAALALGNGLILLIGAAAGIAMAWRQKIWQEPARAVLLVLGTVLFPLSCGLTRLFSELSPNLCYPFLMGYVLAAALLDRAVMPKAGGLLRKIACVVFAVVVLANAQICSLIYTASATAHRATETFAANLVARVEQMPGYRRDLEVVIIGTFPRAVYYSEIPAFDSVEHYSCLSDTVMQLNKHVYYYLNDWLNVPWQMPPEEIMTAVSDSPEFQAMPLYPDDGSIRIEDGRVIVKLAPQYTPKAPYEIAYENRH